MKPVQKGLLTLTVATLCSVAILEGHAELLRTDPAAGSVLSSVPGRVRISLSEPIDAPANAVTVTGPGGTRVDRRDSRVAPDDEDALEVSLGGQGNGIYTVRWHAISADSHPISGTFQFGVGPTGTAPPQGSADPLASTPGDIPLQAAARWFHLLGLALLTGPLALLALLGAKAVDLPPTRHALLRCSWLGALVLLPAAVLSLVAQSAAVTGSLGDGLQAAALLDLLHTRWGRLWILRVAVVAAAGAIATLAVRRAAQARSSTWRDRAVLVLSGGLVFLTALNGHSAATAPIWLSLTVDWIHVAAAVLWIGGLIGLAAVVLPAAWYLGAEARQKSVGSIVPRFSTAAIVLVEALLLTGLYHTWAHVSEPGALVSTAYGRTLLIKLALVIAMLLPGAFNLLVVRAKLVRGRDPISDVDLRRFQWSVAAETLLGVAVLGAVGILTSLPPATAAEAAPRRTPIDVTGKPAVTLSAPAGMLLVTLAIGPGVIGSNRFDLRVQDSSGTVPPDLDVRLRIHPPPESQIAPWIVVPERLGDRYQASITIAPEGRWGIDVTLTRGGVSPATATFQVTFPLTGSAEAAAGVEALKTFPFRGKVESIDLRARTLTVNGENVAGWMGAMTMMYGVDDDDILDKLKAGDQITATVRSGDFQVLHGVRVTQP